MNLTRKGRTIIKSASMAFFTLPCTLMVPVLLVSKSTNNIIWMIVLLICQFSLAGVFDLAFYKVIRKEQPDYPTKASQYTPAQSAWVKMKRQKLLSKWPYFALGLALFFCVQLQGSRMDKFIVWLLLQPMPFRVIISSVLSIIGFIFGIILGNYSGNVRIRRAAELMEHKYHAS